MMKDEEGIHTQGARTDWLNPKKIREWIENMKMQPVLDTSSVQIDMFGVDCYAIFAEALSHLVEDKDVPLAKADFNTGFTGGAFFLADEHQTLAEEQYLTLFQNLAQIGNIDLNNINLRLRAKIYGYFAGALAVGNNQGLNKLLRALKEKTETKDAITLFLQIKLLPTLEKTQRIMDAKVIKTGDQLSRPASYNWLNTQLSTKT